MLKRHEAGRPAEAWLADPHGMLFVDVPDAKRKIEHSRLHYNEE